MSRTVDERVVEMRFDNKQFESGVQTSLSTLEKLKRGLDLDGAAKGFDQLSTAAKKCDMSAIGRSVETVQAKFSAFEVVAMTALSNITNSAVNAGKRLLSSLTIEPISTGFSEYELKMGSIQTIMASTGESLDKVNQKLDELNKYSDRTIYSFSDMTSNIGKFTNAGVKLDDAVAAIQGVSNVAAVSGANANEASRAMYNFAQALSAGYVKLIDWKSIENANMATVEFKTQLLESAVAAGTLTRTADGMYKTLAKGTVIDATHMFNDSLQEQWMTTEVLTSTLKDYADETTEIGKKAFAAAQDVKTWSQLLDTLKESAQSGWAETWQLIAGDYEEAKTTLRTFSEFFSSIIDGSSEARNSLLQGALMSSWGQLKNRVNETGISVDSFRDTLRETAEGSVEGLDKMIEEAGSFDAALSKGWLTTDILSDTLDNLVSKAAGTQVSISELSDEQLQNIGYTQEQIDALRALSEEAKSSGSNLASLVSTLGRQSGRELLFDSLLNGAKAVQGLFQTIKGAWQDIFPPATSEQLYSFIEALHSASERIRDFFTQAEEGADGFTGVINKPLQDIGNTFKGLFAILDIVKQAFSALWRVITPAGSAVGGLLTGVLGLTGSFGEWLVKLDESIKKGDVFYKGLKTIVDVVKGAITAVTGFAAAIGESLGFPGLDGATASVEAFLGTLKEKVGAPGLEKLQVVFDGICTRVKWVKDGIVGMKDSVVDSMGEIDGAVSGNKFVQVLTGIGTLIRQVASAIGGLLGKAIDGLINTLSNANFNGILDFLNALAAGGIIAAINKFIDPVEELENTFTSLKDWVKGLGGGVTKILDGVRGSLEAWQTKLKSDALGKIAASIAVLSVSLLVLSSIDSDKVTGSLAAMGTMFAELIASMAVLDKLSIDGKAANKTASAMIKMGAALLVLSLAMKNIGELEPEQLAEGLIGVGVLLAEIDLFLNTAKFDKNASKSATGMILFAAAIKILSTAVKSLGEMDWDDMAKGLVGVGVLLAEVEIFLNNAKFNGKAVLTATGIVILASAIKVLASACKDFGSMSWGEITKGLTSIAALLLEITAFTKLTGDAKHVISTGLALIEIAAAMKIFASAMSDFGSMSGSEIAKGLMAMGGALAEVAIAVNLMPKNMVSVGAGLVVVGAALKIVASALSSMGNMSWEEIAKGLVAMGGALAELAIGLNVMNGTLAGSAALLVAAGALTVLTPVLVILGNMSWEAIAKGLTAGAILVELANTVPNTGGLVSFFAGDNDLETFGEQIVPFGEAMKAYSDSITGIDAEAVTASTTAAQALAQLQASLPNMGGLVDFFTGSNDLSTFAEGIIPFGEAMKSYGQSVSGIDAEAITASAVAAQALSQLQATLPNVGGVMEFFTGGNDLGKFSEGLVPFGAAMKSYSDSVAGINAEAITASATAAKSLAELQSVLPNVGGVMEFFTGGNDLGTFAAGIIPFGTAMKSYGEAVADINAEAITASAIAAQSLAQLQTTLPAVGGVMEFFTGGNDLATFAATIVPFGAAMKSYGEAVAEINTESITASAIAAQSLAQLQTTLPQIGGVMEFFTGSYDLAAFGESLIPFGEAMSSYGAAVAGIDAGAVTNSATAGQALVELANTLPKCGGLAEVFTGSNSLAAFGNEIVQFGKDLSAYANAIKDVKPEIVTASANAAQALSNLATGLPDSSLFDKWFGGDQTLASFGKDIASFGADMSNYYAKVASIDLTKLAGVITQVWSLVDLAKEVKGIDASGFTSFGNALKAMANTGISEFTSAFSNSTTEVNKAVQGMLNSVSASISNGKTLTTPGMESVMKSLADVVTKKATEINNSVTTLMKGVATTIRNSAPSVKSAMQTALSGAVTTLNNLKPQFETAGKNAGQGFINGINSKLSSATAAGRSLGLAALNAAKKALDSHSPSREFIHLGENMGEGLAIGAKNSIVPASQATSKMIDEVLKVSSKGIEAFQEWAEEKKYYGELSLKDELAGYENLQQRYKAGSEERIKIDREVYRIQNELVAATYQASIDWIEEKKFYNQLSTQEELEAYERMQQRYLEGSEERKKIDREVYTLRKQLMDESYQHSMDWIEEEKYYNRMSLSDELAAYKRVQSRYAKGTDERKKMDREVYRLEQEIYEAQKQYISDVQSVQSEANQKRLDLEEEYANKVKSINEKLASDIQSLNDKYQSALESRTNSLYQSYGLFDEVKEREEVSGETLMKNLTDQVKEFGEWQDILDSLSARGLDSELVGELQEMGPSAIAQIKALNSMSDSELEKYAALWSIKHAQAREQAVGELEGLRIETQNNIAQLRVDAERELDDYRATWQTKMNQVTIDANRELEELRQAFGEKVGLIKKDTEKETQEMADAAQAILKEAGWDETGKQIVTGIKAGVEEEKPNFLDALTQMALDGVQAVKDTLDINSPSRVFQELGNFTGLGFVKGLTDYADKSYDAAANMAGYATDGLSNAISTVSDLVNGEFDMQPSIRPVLDFTDVARGAGELNNLFGYTRTLALAGQTSLAFNSTLDKDGMTVTVDNDGVVQELRSLRSEMAEMTARLERMQVVLDTGTLVGEMADPLDAALGQKQAFRGRGI